MDNKTLSGHAALVTGGASGIGFATAHGLAANGADVAIFDLDAAAARGAAERIARATGGRTCSAAGDVSRADDVERAVQAVARALRPVTVVVNNAGIMAPRLLPLEALSMEELDTMWQVHVRGTLLVSRAVLPEMKRMRFGRIINISSVVGLVGMPRRIGYSSAKAAIVGITRSLAVETGRYGITVNAIAPGYILTPTLQARLETGMLDLHSFAERTPVGRCGTPEEVASLVGFIASPQSAYITGTVIPVDGGYSVRGDPDGPLD